MQINFLNYYFYKEIKYLKKIETLIDEVSSLNKTDFTIHIMIFVREQLKL